MASHVFKDSLEAVEVDFSTLPDVVWLAVLKLLPVTDVYHTCITCRRLYDLFDNPAVWRTASLTISASDVGVDVVESMPQGQKIMAGKFGHFFENVSIEARLVSDRLEEETGQVLAELSRKWHLKFLKLRLMPAPFERCSVLLAVLNTVLMHAPDLRMLAFAVSRSQACEEAPLCLRLLDCALSDEWSFRQLTALHLYWLPDDEIKEDNPVQPLTLASPTVTLVSRLASLQHLLLRSFNISDQLLHALSAADRCRLRSLSVSVLDSSFDDRHPPEVSSAAWAEVASACPALEVRVIVKELVSQSALERLFKPETPVVSVEFPRKCFFDGAKNVTDLIAFSIQFSASLKSLVCSENCVGGTACDEALVALVSACSKLRCLVYNGGVSCQAMARLERLDRPWRRLQVGQKESSSGH